MNYNIILFIFKFLSKLPTGFGNFLYHFLQKLIRKNNITHKINVSKNSYKIAQLILEKSNVSISNKNMLEIGSGWAPIMPYFFAYYSKVKKVVSFDIGKHYNLKTTKKLNSYFQNQLNIEIFLKENSKDYLPNFLKYYPYTNLTTTTCFNNENIEFIFSRNTLEHIPPSDIYKMHKNFSEQIQQSFYVLHMISPSDHRAYKDKSLSYHDFLKYSQEEWNTKQTRFDYHNRLRLPQYLKIFEDLKYEIVCLEYDKCSTDSEKFKRYKKLKLHKDFENFTDEENLAGSINILLKKSI